MYALYGDNNQAWLNRIISSMLKADLLESLEMSISADPYKESLKILKKTLKNNIFREKERIDALKSLSFNEF